jgi:hypothetical protein
MIKYMSLYDIAIKNNATVAQVLSTKPLNISFQASVGRREPGQMA